MTDQKNRSSTFINAIGFALVFELAFLVILYKSVYVPITHDEAYTALIYPKYTYWQLMMYPESYTNNHILNTLLVKFLISYVGMEPGWIRLPNVLAFLVYTLAVFRISRALFRSDSPILLPAAILFICNPFFLDFFSLCRGYGLSNSLVALSVSFLVTGAKQAKLRDLWLAFFLGMLASYANFTSLIYWAAVTVVIFLYLLLSYRHTLRNLAVQVSLLILSCIGYGLLILSPVLKMQKENAFRDFSGQSFYTDTLLSLSHDIRTLRFSITFLDHLIAVVLVLAVIFNLAYCVFRFYRSGRDPGWLRRPMFLVSLTVLVAIAVNVLQHVVLKTPYLSGRIGMFYFPLLISAFVSLLGFLDTLRALSCKGTLTILVSLGLLFNLAVNTRIRSVQEWWFTADTVTVIDMLNVMEKDQVVRLKTDWTFYPSFAYYKKMWKMPNIILEEYDKNIDMNTRADYYYIYDYDSATLRNRFVPIWEPANMPILMKAKQHLDLTPQEMHDQDLEQVAVYKTRIRKDSVWMAVEAQKALARGITLDEMVTRDAMYSVAKATNKRYQH